MGLDMFLFAKTSKYHSKWQKDSTEKDYEYPEALSFFQTDIGGESSASVGIRTTYKIGYWRKFNALHGYIVNNYFRGDYDDYDGGPIDLSDKNISEMLEILKEIQKEPDEAATLMPVQSGFFFGSYKYDDWYFQDVSYTIILFENLLKVMKSNPEYQISYEASW